MRTIFKKSAIALAVLTLAGTSFAGPFNGFFGGMEGLYLKPTNGDLNYVTVYPTTTTGSFSTPVISLESQWGWRLFGGMTFCGDEDITASWMHFNTTDTNVTQPDQLAHPNSAPRFLIEDTWKNITGHVSFNLDDYYAVFGHTINFNAWSFRYAGGVEYARLESNMTTSANFTLLTAGPTVGYTAKSDLRGIGPRFEADFVYYMPWGVSVFAKGNAAVLISHRIVSLNTLDILDGAFPSSDFGNRYPIVPKAGVRLGLSFSHTFGGVGAEGATGPSTTMGMDVGWQAEGYVHAIERPSSNPHAVSGLAPHQSNDVTNITTIASNYGNQGPFLGAYLSTSWL